MVGDSPLWYRGSRSGEHSGAAEATELGLSASLRRDLQAWNDVFEQTWDDVFDDRDQSRPVPSPSVPPAAVAAHRVEAFTLASRVQLELGDDVHVWCGAGEGIDLVTESGTAVVLPSRRTGRMSSSCVTGSATSDQRAQRAPVREQPEPSCTGVPSLDDSERRSATLRPALSGSGQPGACRATSGRTLRSSSTLARQPRTDPTGSTEVDIDTARKRIVSSWTMRHGRVGTPTYSPLRLSVSQEPSTTSSPSGSSRSTRRSRRRPRPSPVRARASRAVPPPRTSR